MGIISDLADKFFTGKNKDEGTPLEPVESVNDQSNDERKLVDHIRQKIDTVRTTNSRVAIESIYMTNLSYLLGYSGVYYDSTYRQFKNVDVRRKASRSRLQVNKILPTIQNRLARLTQSPPRYDVRPESPSSEDKDCARLGLKVLEDVFERNYFDELRQDLIMSTMQGGHAYVQTLWDPMLGKPMVDPETGELVGCEGDVRLEVLNCLEIYPDPLAKRLEDCQYIIKAKVRKLEYFRERYPDRGNAVKEEDVWLMSSLYDLKSNALTSVGITGSQTSDQTKNAAIELVYYEKRSLKYPEGRMVVAANGILLEDKPLPTGEYDIVKFDDVMIGGRYNSEAVITHLRPIQDQYNITRNKCAQWIRTTLSGKYIAAKGHEMMEESLTNDTEVLEYTPVPNAAPPMAMTIPQIPSYVYKDLENQSLEFDFISGINEISRGVLPSASMPAQGMAFLQEQDQTRIGAQTARNEIGYAKIGKNILKYIHRYYIMPRMLKVAGDGLEYAVKEFVGQDLKGNLDVYVIPGSTIPSSKVLKRQDIMNAYMSGIMGNPQDDNLKMKVLKMTEYGDVADVWKTQALNAAQIKKQIDEIVKDGRMPDMSTFDDHAAHLVEMNDYRKTDKFEQLDDYRKGLFIYCMEWHLQAMNDLANPGLAIQRINAENNMKTQVNDLGNTEQQLADHPGAPGASGDVAPPRGTQPNQVQGIDASGAPTAPPMQQPPPQPKQF